MEIGNRIAICFLLSTSIYVASSDKLILTSTGPVRGLKVITPKLDVEAFLSIPYAEPPIGELRFKKPVPARPWNDVYNATTMPPPCCQNGTQKFYWMPNIENMTEDCLYLNIWVPQLLIQNKGTKLLTVMVWVHGGAFNIGSSNMDIYDGAKLAAHGEVIVVSLNYRIGVFGFLTALIENANGNMGMYDQILALQWLKKNVVAFGGDPEQIVLFGESAGAMSIALHLVSPLARNLFKRAILQSGGGIHPISYEASKKHVITSNKIAKIVGCADSKMNITTHPQRVVDCLKRVPFKDLTQAEGRLMKTNPITFYPRWGDEYLPNEPIQAQREFQYKNTELLVGVTRDEGSFFLTAVLSEYFGIYGQNGVDRISKRLAKTLIKGMFRILEESNLNGIADFYIRSVGNETSEAFRKAIYNSIGDYMVTCNSVLFSDLYSRKQNKVYYYVFNHRPTTTFMAEWAGVTHFDDVQYVFGHSVTGENFTEDEENLSRRVMDRWLAFAKNGNPNIPGELKWPLYTYKHPVYLNIDVKEEIKKYPSEKRCEFWRDRFNARINTTEIAARLIDDNNASPNVQNTLWFAVLGFMIFLFN